MGIAAQQTRSLAVGNHSAHNDWRSRIEVRCDIRPDLDAAATAKAAGTPYATERRV